MLASDLNSPLTSITLQSAAALRWLSGDKPNIQEAILALQRLYREVQRARELADRLRGE